MPRKKIKQPTVTITLKSYEYALMLCASVVIALCTWAIADSLGWLQDIRLFLFGNRQTFGEMEKGMEGSLYDKSRTVLALVAIYFFLFLVLYGVLFVLASVIVWFFYSRWKKLVVFISYKNNPTDKKGTTSIAEEIRAHLVRHGVAVHMQQYVANPHHDDLNHAIKEAMQKCRVVIVVPDPVHPSYVNAEIFAAFYANKPLLLIMHTTNQRLPDTATSGHPVLMLDRLKRHKYKPLVKLIRYLDGHMRAQLAIVENTVEAFLGIMVNLTDDKLFFKAAIGGLFTCGMLMVIDTPIDILLMVLHVLIVCLGVVAGFRVINRVWKDVKARQQTRQSVRSVYEENVVYDLLQDAGLPADVLACVDQKGLELQRG